AERPLRVGPRRLGETGIHARQRRFDAARSRLLSRPRRHDVARLGHRAGQRHRHRFDQLRRRFHQHAPRLLLLPLPPAMTLPLVAAALLVTARLAAQGTGTIGGTVTDSSGHPVATAQISVDGAALHASTDSAGRFRLADVPPGAITLRVKRIGYFPLTLT